VRKSVIRNLDFVEDLWILENSDPQQVVQFLCSCTVRKETRCAGLMYYDPEFYTYLKLHMADDLLFCYR
jgi:hypothetical protein